MGGMKILKKNLVGIIFTPYLWGGGWGHGISKSFIYEYSIVVYWCVVVYFSYSWLDGM
jgi:hypothetical protein